MKIFWLGSILMKKLNPKHPMIMQNYRYFVLFILNFYNSVRVAAAMIIIFSSL